MKENLVDKIKLMMFYDMSKTLVENKKVNNIIEEQEINEINPVDAEDAAQTLKNIGTGGRKAATAIADDIVSTMSRGGEGGEAIHIIGKNNNLIPVANGDELLNALRSGTIDAQNLARVNKGILKSGAVTDTNILRNIASDVIYEPNFIKKYGKEYGKVNGEAKVTKLLQDNGYTKNAIDEIVKKIKLDQNYGLKVRKVTGTRGTGDVKGGNGATTGDATTAGGAATKEAEGKVIQTINLNVNSNNTGADLAKKTEEEIKAGGLDPNTTAVAQESVKVTEKMKPTTWEKWKKWSKEHPNSTKLIYFLGLAAGAWASYKLIFGNTDPKEVKDKTFTNCVGDLQEINGTKILTTKSGDPVISVPTTGNQDYDSHKGLMFYQNNRVFLGDQSKRGTWGCNGSNVAVQAEQTTGMPGADMGIGMLNRIAVNKQLNKQKTGKTESASSVLNRISITWDSDAQSTGGGQKQTEPQPVVVPQPPIVSGDTTNTTGSTTGDTTTTNTTTTTGSTTNDSTNQTNAGLASMLKTSDNKPQEVTPEIEQLIDRGKEIYTRLYDNYNAEGQPKPFIKKDGNRLKYKGKRLTDPELNALNQYIKSLGYSYMKQKDKRYISLEDDVKYVWEKNDESEVQQPETQAQEPTQLSEDFIKKIVSKHLRSKL